MSDVLCFEKLLKYICLGIDEPDEIGVVIDFIVALLSHQLNYVSRMIIGYLLVILN